MKLSHCNLVLLLLGMLYRGNVALIQLYSRHCTRNKIRRVSATLLMCWHKGCVMKYVHAKGRPRGLVLNIHCYIISSLKGLSNEIAVS
jgi:hypothetical protein